MVRQQTMEGDNNDYKELQLNNEIKIPFYALTVTSKNE